MDGDYQPCSVLPLTAFEALMLTWSYDHQADSSVWTVNGSTDNLKEEDQDEKEHNKRVHFSPNAMVVLIPCREDYHDITSQLWWSRNELMLTSNQASFTLRETLSRNPSLTIESAMCLLYQSNEMFNSRIRLLVVDNDGDAAALARNRIVDCQRANIWTVQCCSYDTAYKVIARGNLCFDMVLINCTENKLEIPFALELAILFRKAWHDQLLLGISCIGKFDERSSKALGDVKIDFFWNERTPEKMESPHHVHLKSLLASRHLRGAKSSNVAENLVTCSSANVLDLKFSVFSYPIGYKLMVENLVQ